MISICLRRPEFVPRAYQIFRQILEDTATGLQRTPEADVWGRVIEGMASLGNEKTGSDNAQTWRRRAAKLVERWEAISGIRLGGREELPKDGLKVYQGWFCGIVRWVDSSMRI
jgi:DNA-directed RNA polymerase